MMKNNYFNLLMKKKMYKMINQYINVKLVMILILVKIVEYKMIN